MTKYCKTCSFCTTRQDGYYCCYLGKNKTEKQICHTTECHHHMGSIDGIDIVTGKKYKPYRRKYYQADLFSTIEEKGIWETIKQYIQKTLQKIKENLQ